MTVFGTNPSERLNPSFREEDEHMGTELNPVVIGPPAYASPDPATLAGRLVPVEEHPLELSEDYGASVLEAATAETVVGTDYHQSSRTPEELLEDDARAQLADAPADRSDWNKANWQTAARSYSLPVGGKKDEIQARVEAYESELNADKEMNAFEWVEEVEAAEDADELSAVRSRYGATGNDYATVEAAFEKAQAEFDNPSE